MDNLMSIPTYTSDESRVKLKLKCDNTLTEYDLDIVKSDVVGKFFKKISSAPSHSDIINYMNIKYPGWDKYWKLADLI